MSTQIDYFQVARGYAETALDNLADTLETEVENVIQNQLDAWATRYHRHRFQVKEAHGALLIMVSPPIDGETAEWGFLSQAPEWVRRGAIALLCAEADNLAQCHQELTWCFTPSEITTLFGVKKS